MNVRPLYGSQAGEPGLWQFYVEAPADGFEFILPFEPKGLKLEVVAVSMFWTASAVSAANAAYVKFYFPVAPIRELIFTTGDLGALGGADTVNVTFALHGAQAFQPPLFGNIAVATATLPVIPIMEPFQLRAAFETDGAGAVSQLNVLVKARS